jgi:hypothetical protein
MPATGGADNMVWKTTICAQGSALRAPLSIILSHRLREEAGFFFLFFWNFILQLAIRCIFI